jgi:hypothetical protein
MGRFGWAKTDLAPDTALWAISLNINPAAFTLARAMKRALLPPGGQTATPDAPLTTTGSGEDAPKEKMARWACACTNLRCATELNALCFKCGQPFAKGAKANPKKNG